MGCERHQVGVIDSDALHFVQTSVNILLNKHKKGFIGTDGVSRCGDCSEVWPCSTRILIAGYSEAVQKLTELGEDL